MMLLLFVRYPYSICYRLVFTSVCTDPGHSQRILKVKYILLTIKIL